MTRLPDLSYAEQAILACTLLLGLALVLVRGTVAFRRFQSAVPHRYPAFWTQTQIRFLEQIRVAVGLVLVATWVGLLIAIPAMPESWPFGSRQALLTIALLLLTNAWILLIIPRDWEGTFFGRLNFHRAAGCILIWWTILLGVSLLAVVQAAGPAAERPVYVMGVYA